MNDPFRILGSTLAGKYRVDRVIGEGGFGVVYGGWHVLDQPLAIKCIKPLEVMATDAQRASGPFLREAQILFALSHPGIVRLYDVGTLEGAAPPVSYAVLELVQGVSLEEDIARRARERVPYAAIEIRRVFTQILEAMAFAHERGVVHRDLKPSNVMLTYEPGGAVRAKILDFGIARASFTALTMSAPATPRYAAPEQWDPSIGAVGPGSDLFAIGLIDGTSSNVNAGVSYRKDDYDFRQCVDRAVVRWEFGPTAGGKTGIFTIVAHVSH